MQTHETTSTDHPSCANKWLGDQRISDSPQWQSIALWGGNKRICSKRPVFDTFIEVLLYKWHCLYQTLTYQTQHICPNYSQQCSSTNLDSMPWPLTPVTNNEITEPAELWLDYWVFHTMRSEYLKHVPLQPQETQLSEFHLVLKDLITIICLLDTDIVLQFCFKTLTIQKSCLIFSIIHFSPSQFNKFLYMKRNYDLILINGILLKLILTENGHVLSLRYIIYMSI